MENKRKDQKKVQKHATCKRTNKEKELIPFGVGSRKPNWVVINKIKYPPNTGFLLFTTVPVLVQGGGET